MSSNTYDATKVRLTVAVKTDGAGNVTVSLAASSSVELLVKSSTEAGGLIQVATPPSGGESRAVLELGPQGQFEVEMLVPGGVNACVLTPESVGAAAAAEQYPPNAVQEGGGDVAGYVNPDGTFFVAERDFGGAALFVGDNARSEGSGDVVGACGAVADNVGTGETGVVAAGAGVVEADSVGPEEMAALYEPANDFDPDDVHGVVQADGSVALCSGRPDNTHGGVNADGSLAFL